MIFENNEEIFERNYNYIRVLFRCAFSVGVNLTAPSKIKEALKLFNVLLVVASLTSLYGHWCYVIRNFDSIPLLAETVCTALQLLISAFKMLYLLFTQRIFYRLLYQTMAHELVREIEILKHDFPINQQLRREIDDIMNEAWKRARRQILFYFYCCFSIGCNYLFGAFFVNLYHQLKQTPDYKFILPFPELYPFWEEKGMTFPYYPIQFLLSGISVYTCVICAVSFESIFIALCQHAVGLVKVHNLLVLRITSPLLPAERRLEYLRYTIVTYQRIYAYMQQIQTIFKHISLSHFLLNLFVLGFLLFDMSFGLESNKIIFIRMIMYISAVVTQIIIYCYNGQSLTSVCEEIPILYYNCNWYEESKTFKDLIMMMIMRTNKDFYLEVSWFTLMSFTTMIDLFRASGSYYLLLQNFQEG